MADRTPTTSVLSTPRRSLIGQRFGMLVVAELVGSHGKTWRWRCICDCGADKIATTVNLLSGSPSSCGCEFHRKIHGYTVLADGEHPLYRTWCKMKERCYNPRHDAYRFYGAIGITVCDRWRHDFVTFLADVGDRPTPKHSLDRIDGSKGYEPGNCRWATQTEQCRNRKDTRFVTYLGQKMSLAEAAERSGLPYSTIKNRLSNLGWTELDALSTPVNGRPRHRK